jgi:HEAT repeat protein
MGSSLKATAHSFIDDLDVESEVEARSKITSIIRTMGRSALPELTEAVETDKRARVRRWAVEALGLLGGKKAVNVVLRAISDKNMSVRLHALLAVSLHPSTRTIEAIKGALRDESGGIRVNAIDCLARLNHTDCKDELRTACSDTKWYVRAHAARAIGELRIDAASELRTLENDPHPGVRKASSEALRRLGYKN